MSVFFCFCVFLPILTKQQNLCIAQGCKHIFKKSSDAAREMKKKRKKRKCNILKVERPARAVQQSKQKQNNNNNKKDKQIEWSQPQTLLLLS